MGWLFRSTVDYSKASVPLVTILVCTVSSTLAQRAKCHGPGEVVKDLWYGATSKGVAVKRSITEFTDLRVFVSALSRALQDCFKPQTKQFTFI